MIATMRVSSVVQTTSELIRRVSPACGVLLTGSATDGERRAPKDVDLIVASLVDVRQTLQASLPNLQEVIDGSMRFEIDGMRVGIVAFTIDELRHIVRTILDDEHRLCVKPWAIGVEYPEGFLGDIAHGQIIRDTPNADLAALAGGLWPYPELLRAEILKQSAYDLGMRREQLRSLEPGDALNILLLRAHLLINIVRCLYALEKQYCRGTKRAPAFTARNHPDFHSLVSDCLDAGTVEGLVGVCDRSLAYLASAAV